MAAGGCRSRKLLDHIFLSMQEVEREKKKERKNGSWMRL